MPDAISGGLRPSSSIWPKRHEIWGMEGKKPKDHVRCLCVRQRRTVCPSHTHTIQTRNYIPESQTKEACTLRKNRVFLGLTDLDFHTWSQLDMGAVCQRGGAFSKSPRVTIRRDLRISLKELRPTGKSYFYKDLPNLEAKSSIRTLSGRPMYTQNT